MELEGRKSTSGYGKPPWIFKGSALYQLHLVKSETARAFIPKEFRLVEAFGYTLGGFFLASYDESPAGEFDELVVIAGIVWNAPTSCAWAARVLVNSDEACRHGRKDVGLPSQVARFSKRVSPTLDKPRSKSRNFLKIIDAEANYEASENTIDVEVAEITGRALTDICNITLPITVPESKSKNRMGPAISISLPSFSGRTIHNPNLLKYSCRIECRVQAVKPAKVSRPSPAKNSGTKQYLENKRRNKATKEEIVDKGQDLSILVMLSKPLLALEFHCLKMQVEAPTIVSPARVTSSKGS